MANLDSQERRGEIVKLVPRTLVWRGPEDPALAYFALRREGRPSFLFESAVGSKGSVGYSIVGTDPLLHVKAKGKKLVIRGQNEIVRLAKRKCFRMNDPLKSVGKALMIDEVDAPTFPSKYAFGAFGYVGYDYALSQPNVRVGEPPVPEIEFMVPGRVLLFDHLAKTLVHISVAPFIEGEKIENSFFADYSAPPLREEGSQVSQNSLRAF